MTAFRSWMLPPSLPSPPAVRRLEAPPGPLLELADFDEASARNLLRVLEDAGETLRGWPSGDVADRLGAVGERFLRPGDPLRVEALRRLPESAGYTPPMAEAVLDGMAADWTRERLRRLLTVEFGPGPSPLDGFVERAGEGRSVRALGAPLALHVASGSVPGVSVTSALRSLLVATPVLLKPGRGDVVLPVLFARGLAETAPELSAALAVVYWPGEEGGPLLTAALAAADLVVVYGGGPTVAALRDRLRPSATLVAYAHRVGVAVVGQRALAGADLARAGREVARAAALFEQRGCVSPHVAFVHGDREDAERVAGAVADGLQALASELPQGPLDEATASAVHQLRGAEELRAAAGEGRVRSGGRAPWTVVTDPTGEATWGGPPRTVRVRPFADEAALVAALEPLRPHLQTVGWTGVAADQRASWGEALARLGVSRLAPVEQAPWPPPWWMHDGRGPLRALVRWTERVEEHAPPE